MKGARGTLGAALASAAALTAAACSITVGFDGFVGPEHRASDAGDVVRDAGAPTTPGEQDARAPEGPGTKDAGVEPDTSDPNVPPRFVDGGSFCTTRDATFCEDFDTQDLSARWIREGLFGKLTSYAPRSAPNVFLIDVPPTSAGGTFVSKITRDFDEPSTNLVLDFDVKPERVNEGSSFLMLAALEWTRGESKYSLRFVYSNGSVRLEESNVVPPPNNKDSYHPFFTLPMGEWTRVTLDVVASGQYPRAEVLLDGVAAGAREAITPTPELDARPTLILGAVFAGNPHTGWTLRYDDVSVTYR